jgi:S1-C subfamily serine protease
MVDSPAAGQQSTGNAGVTVVTAIAAAIGGGLVAAIILSVILALFGVFGGGNKADYESPPVGFVSADFAKGVASTAGPSVVAIIAGDKLVDPETNAATSVPAGQGSGVIISADGYIVTNNHVVTKQDLTTPEDEVLVRFGAEYVPARIVGRDALNDIAVIKVERSGLQPIKIGSSDELKPGDPIVVIGNAKGVGISVSTGIVSATGRTFGEELYTRQQAAPGELAVLATAIQVDAAVNQGNSGGALINIKGEFVGIPSAGLGGVMHEAQGLNYCIPIGLAKGIIEDLIANGKAFHPYLGANTITVDHTSADMYALPVQQGAFIDSVDPDSPAEKAGLQPSDIIVSLAGKDVSTQLELAGAINAQDIGKKVEIGAWRLDPATKEWSDFKVSVTLIEVLSVR